jgi:hypothetical protein
VPKSRRPQLFRSHRALAFAAAIVCHCMFATLSGPPQVFREDAWAVRLRRECVARSRSSAARKKNPSTVSRSRCVASCTLRRVGVGGGGAGSRRLGVGEGWREPPGCEPSAKRRDTRAHNLGKKMRLRLSAFVTSASRRRARLRAPRPRYSRPAGRQPELGTDLRDAPPAALGLNCPAQETPLPRLETTYLGISFVTRYGLASSEAD